MNDRDKVFRVKQLQCSMGSIRNVSFAYFCFSCYLHRTYELCQDEVPAVIRSFSSPCTRSWNCFKNVIMVGNNCCLDGKFTGAYDLGSTQGSPLHKASWEIKQ